MGVRRQQPIVKLDTAAIATVTRTLLVGDEPRDIVFGGANRDRAFITTAHRGQNTGDPDDQQVEGKGRADVWVFDANNLGTAAGGNRLTKLTFFSDAPRALAVSADGSKVYAAAFASGNQTTVMSPFAVQQINAAYGSNPVPTVINGFPQPPTGLIAKFKDVAGGHWFDPYGRVVDPVVKLKLPDYDVFQIDANANPPAGTGAAGTYAHVGTTLFNMAVNPVSGKVYVTNTEAHNDIRFEGHTPGFTTVRGRIADSRITVIDPTSGAVAPRDLNPHVDFTQEGNDAEKKLSLAFPQDVTVSKDGTKLYTVAQGSGKLAIYNTADLEAGNTMPTMTSQVTLSGGGPTGVVLDESNGRAFVLTRFDNSISIVNTSTRAEVGKVTMFNPEPESVVVGRKYLYDANLTSQHGTTSCASCHIGGDKDELSWDLGNPGGFPLPIPTQLDIHTVNPALIAQLLPMFANVFKAHATLKGPMTTQSLRGMDNHGAMHWRGDRNGAIAQNGAPFADNPTAFSAQPNTGIYDEVKAFKSFNVAFPGLIGNAGELSDSDMTEFTTFILQASYPPNPNRNLDNSLTPVQAAGRAFFFNHDPVTGAGRPSDRFFNCDGCHTLDPAGNAGATAHPGFFGSSGKMSFENEAQIFKVPHLRNLYTKVGMFGSSPDTLQPGTIILQTQDPVTGGAFVPKDQIRGFGFQHEGALGSLEHFFTSRAFLRSDEVVPVSGAPAPLSPNPFGIAFIDPNVAPPAFKLYPQSFDANGQPQDVGGFQLRHSLAAFMLVFDTNEAPIVGQQITLTKDNAAAAGPRVDLLEARASVGECDLVAKSSSLFGANGGFLFKRAAAPGAAGTWQPATTGLPALGDSQLRQLVGIGLLPPVTFTCVPVGSGSRVAIDRDGDGYADWDEIVRFKDPADPDSHP